MFTYSLKEMQLKQEIFHLYDWQRLKFVCSICEHMQMESLLLGVHIRVTLWKLAFGTYGKIIKCTKLLTQLLYTFILNDGHNDECTG